MTALIEPSAVELDAALREAAIYHTGAPLEIKAPHGSGKTELLLRRCARLEQDGEAWRQEWKLITFTRKATRGAKERLQLLLGEDADDLPVLTIHSLGRSILQTALGLRDFRVVDPQQASFAVQRAMKDCGLSEQVFAPEQVADLIADAKEQGRTPEGFVSLPGSRLQKRIAQVYACYQDLLRSRHAYDFADLICEAALLLGRDAPLREQVQMTTRFLMVDEWQDTSPGQYALIRQLVGPEQDIVVAGSEDQSIYEWRQANYQVLSAAFRRDFPDVQEIELAVNFRSKEPIVKAAAALFANAPERYAALDIHAACGSGDPIYDVRVLNDVTEAAFVAHEAQSLAQAGRSLADIAVLFRTREQAALLEEEFMHRRVRYTLVDTPRLLHRREIRDVLAYLVLALRDDDHAANQVLNIPARGIGPVSLRALKGSLPHITMTHLRAAVSGKEKVEIRGPALAGVKEFVALVDELRHVAKRARPAAMVDEVLERAGYRAWLQEDLTGRRKFHSISELRRKAVEEASLEGYLRKTFAEIAEDLDDPHMDEGVSLMTVHGAKGLQWGVVFVVGMEEGLLPYAKAVQNGHELGERRLAHVAFSRARDRLYLVSAQVRSRDGVQRIYPRPSRYLAALPREIVERHTPMMGPAT